ncbi:hypothetical protein [Streptomyces sp. NPDC093260]|uniref:hypothetical protein n=1 Tax=Streptomyces sp. NPDC093260 TaxID=3155073 RepID=UPI003449E610
MKLGMRDLRWHDEITSLARRLGWVVFEQGRAQQRPEDPTFIAVRGGAVIAVWLRSAAVRPSRVPPVDRFPGVAGYCWSPLDMAKARAVLTSSPTAPVGVLDGAA